MVREGLLSSEKEAMQVQKTKLDGVLLIKLDAFEDFRGQYVETYNEELYPRYSRRYGNLEIDFLFSWEFLFDGGEQR
jgi:dTDP-4-dehydrorhamnose 3,5-epimerase